MCDVYLERYMGLYVRSCMYMGFHVWSCMWDWRYKRSTSLSSLNVSRLRINFGYQSRDQSTSSTVCPTATLQRETSSLNRNAMAVDVDDRGRFHGARLCCERVLSRSRPKTYIVYSSKSRACPSEGPRLSLYLLSVFCPLRTSLIFGKTCLPSL